MASNLIYVNARFLTQKISGVQRFAIELCTRLKKLNPNIRFVCPPQIYHHELANELEVEITGKLKSHLWEQLELPLFLKKKGNPLLINLCNTGPILYSNQIVCIHDAIIFHHPEWFSKLFASWYKFLLPTVAKKSKLILTVSQHAKSDLQFCLKLPDNKVEVIYNSVNENFTKVNSENIQKEKYILSVSSLDPRKNIISLIKAFQMIQTNGYKLILVGADHTNFANNDLSKIINNNENISFTGYVSDEQLVEFYQKASLFVYPSLYEGFGIPPLEAMACGTPVIAADNTSIPEVCKNAAVYIDAERTENIAEKIDALLNDEKHQKELVENGFERLKHFSWDESCIKLNTIINEYK